MKELKSLGYTLILFLIYYWATKGIVKVLCYNNNEDIFNARVRVINILLILFTITYIIGIYHLVGPVYIESYYKIFIFIHFGYIVIGNLLNSIIQKHN
jgi:hypothetical protein